MLMIYSILILLTVLVTPDQKLKNSVDEFLKSRLTEYAKYEFTIVKTPEITGKCEINSSSNINLNGTYVYLPVKIQMHDRGVIQSYITVKLKLFKTVCLAKGRIDPKEPVAADEVEFKLMEVSNLRGTPVESGDYLNGIRSKIKIDPGSVLLKEYLEEIPIINNGDRITAFTIAGSVKVSTDAEARQKGSAGDIISIVTKDKKQFKAKILDSNNVMIIE